ncbi:MAG: hypothetical protein Q9187_004700 [Circinaria calcarea]
MSTTMESAPAAWRMTQDVTNSVAEELHHFATGIEFDSSILRVMFIKVRHELACNWGCVELAYDTVYKRILALGSFGEILNGGIHERHMVPQTWRGAAMAESVRATGILTDPLLDMMERDIGMWTVNFPSRHPFQVLANQTFRVIFYEATRIFQVSENTALSSDNVQVTDDHTAELRKENERLKQENRDLRKENQDFKGEVKSIKKEAEATICDLNQSYDNSWERLMDDMNIERGNWRREKWQLEDEKENLQAGVRDLEGRLRVMTDKYRREWFLRYADGGTYWS